MKGRQAGSQRQLEKFNKKYYLLTVSSIPGTVLGTGHRVKHRCCFGPVEFTEQRGSKCVIISSIKRCTMFSQRTVGDTQETLQSREDSCVGLEI